MLKRLEHLKECMMCAVESQMMNLDNVDTEELGEAIDIIKDLEEATYYCTITKAMNAEEYRDMDRERGRMYYTEKRYPQHHEDKELEFRDYREGRSPQSRKMYMESRETHQGKASQMRELERYVSELTNDIVEMIEGASPEEQQFLANKVQALSSKISSLNK